MMTDTLDDPKRMKIDLKIENIMRAPLLMMADTFETAEENVSFEVESLTITAIENHRQVKRSSAFDEGGISTDRDSATGPGTGVNRLSPSDKSSSDWNKKAGDDEEKEYMQEDEDWSGSEEKRSGVKKSGESKVKLS